MKPVLVTGCSGFSGAHLARILARRGGYGLYGVDAGNSSAHFYERVFHADIGDPTQMAELLQRVRPSYLFNLAGMVHGDASRIYRTNLNGVQNILEAVRLYAPECGVLLIGSAAEYGIKRPEDMPLTEDSVCLPMGPYGASKHAGTLMALNYHAAYGIKVSVARPFNIIGPGLSPDHVLGALLKRMKEQSGTGMPVKVGNLDTQRDFVAIDDVVDAYMRIAEGGHWGEVFNICSGRPVAIRTLVETLFRIAGGGVQYEVDSALVRPTDVPVAYGSYAKAQRIFRFEPKLGIEQVLEESFRHVFGNAKE